MKKVLALGERLQGVARRPRAYVAVVVPLAIPLLLATVNLSEPAGAPPKHLDPAAAPLVRYADLTPPAPTSLPEHATIVTMEDGDTLSSILQDNGLTAAESFGLTNLFAAHVDVRRLRPGHLFRFHYDPAGKVDSVEMKVTAWGEVDAVRGPSGFQVTAQQAQQREIETAVSANIHSSLYEALRSSGESPQLVQELVDVFQWDIDFFALQKGDSFSVVVPKRYSGSDFVGYGPVAAARFTHDGETFEAFRHTTPDGRSGYYSASGTPLRKQFLRAPLQFTRITSGFSQHRFHPLLHLFRPHHGVDYGAPVGTPVMTTADGVVLETAYKHGEGNYVRIRHSSRIETWYLHLSRFGKGIRPGSKVTQGDVIGYVGATGLATGPHLDYRVKDNGEWLDPLTLKSITPDPIRGASLAQFRANVGRLAPKLAAPEAAALAQTIPVRRPALF